MSRPLDRYRLMRKVRPYTPKEVREIEDFMLFSIHAYVPCNPRETILRLIKTLKKEKGRRL